MKKLLIVEDQKVLALMLEDMLIDHHYLVEHAFTVEAAEEVVRDGRVDLAVLDINVDGQLVYSFARRLQAGGTPFVFATSMHRIDVPADLRWQPLIRKPFTCDDILSAIEAMLGTAHEPARAAMPAPSPRTTGEHPVL